MCKRPAPFLVMLVALCACGNKTETTSEQEPALNTGAETTTDTTETTETTPPAPVIAAKRWYAIPELGIQVEVPGAPTREVVLTDVYAINAPGCELQIGKAYEGDDYYEQTLKTLKKNYARIKVKTFSKKENSKDGSFSIEALLQTRLGKMWFVRNRVRIDGTPLRIFGCSSEEMKSAEHAACVSHACATAKIIWSGVGRSCQRSRPPFFKVVPMNNNDVLRRLRSSRHSQAE